ncbi:MAG: carboxymuconolactone decarboxylase family protein [Chloroflexota bacterium]
MTDLLQPLPPDQWDESIQHIAERLGNPLNIHKMIAHHPALMEAYTPLRYHVVGNSVLGGRLRELLILRVAHLIGSEYEWVHHVARGQTAGLTMDEIEQAKLGGHVEGWSAAEQHVLNSADEMIVNHQLSEGSVAGLRNAIGKEGVLDVVFTIGVYLSLGVLLKTFDVPVD